MGEPSQAKRGRVGGEREDSPSPFEEEPALPDESEVEAESREGRAGQDVIPIGNLAKGLLFEGRCCSTRGGAAARGAGPQREGRSCTVHFSVPPAGELFSADLNPQWPRPTARPLRPQADPLIFQQIDLDYYLGN